MTMSNNSVLVRVYNNSVTKQGIRLRAKANSKDFVLAEQQIYLGYDKHIDIEEKYLDMEQLRNLKVMNMISYSYLSS